MAIETTNKLVTAKDLAERYAVSEGTIWRWSKEGRIQAIEVGPKLIRFDLADVVARLESPKPITEPDSN